MRDFTILHPASPDAATAAALAPDTAYIAGGTDLMQLMKQNVEEPLRLVDLDGVLHDGIEVQQNGVMLGALARMADVAAHPVVIREVPAVSEALLSAASPQIRNMGTMGGNLLQRTRCNYFRDTGFPSCNKRVAGTGCGALHGHNRMLGILGTSTDCIATHPSDMPVALAALDAIVLLQGMHGARRRVPIAQFYRLPGNTPQIETVLHRGELIEAVFVPFGAPARRSRYVKVRDRASFEFALVSCAAALEIEGGTVRQARIAVGGVAPMPWRLPKVEQALQGGPATEDAFRTAAAHAAEGAQPASENGFKVALMQRAIVRTLRVASA
jgi:xanthine dehydrogenase YagS FAD-binding subunit